MLKKLLISSVFMATAAIGSVSPSMAAGAPADDPAGAHHLIGRCSPGLLFDSSLLTCDYAGLVSPQGPA
ncbi:carbohydrate-binding module family 14 protein [Streptomyces sp. NPDC026589]|uniref:carbohydrate-binding module family 14 protein n=1 Tax=Streptomyces sp. NPDC026589 TaxID=3155609 RepID=UPI0033E99E29